MFRSLLRANLVTAVTLASVSCSGQGERIVADIRVLEANREGRAIFRGE